MKHNKYDVFKKVKSVIDSCDSHIQLSAARHMIDNFEMMYNDTYLVEVLRCRVQNRVSTIIYDV